MAIDSTRSTILWWLEIDWKIKFKFTINFNFTVIPAECARIIWDDESWWDISGFGFTQIRKAYNQRKMDSLLHSFEIDIINHFTIRNLPLEAPRPLENQLKKKLANNVQNFWEWFRADSELRLIHTYFNSTFNTTPYTASITNSSPLMLRFVSCRQCSHFVIVMYLLELNVFLSPSSSWLFQDRLFTSVHIETLFTSCRFSSAPSPSWTPSDARVPYMSRWFSFSVLRLFWQWSSSFPPQVTT